MQGRLLFAHAVRSFTLKMCPLAFVSSRPRPMTTRAWLPRNFTFSTCCLCCHSIGVPLFAFLVAKYALQNTCSPFSPRQLEKRWVSRVLTEHVIIAPRPIKLRHQLIIMPKRYSQIRRVKKTSQRPALLTPSVISLVNNLRNTRIVFCPGEANLLSNKII